MTDDRGTCRSCGASMVWAKMGSGKPNPLDLETVDQLGVGTVAYNPATGSGRALTRDDIDSGRAATWGERGVTFHLSHFATCPNARRHKGGGA
jgi:hypothetical protein